MSMHRPIRLTTVFFALLTLSALAQELVPGAACSARLTGSAFELDRKAGIYTVDLSGIPKGATIFRAELMLGGRKRFNKPSTNATKVYEAGKPDAVFPLVGPAFRSLDALPAVRAAHKEARALKIKAEVTLQGLTGLEVSYVGGKPETSIPVVTNVKVTHRKGQSLITFTEPSLENFPEFKTGSEVSAFKKKFAEKHTGLRFHIWRSEERITPKTIQKAVLVNRVGPFTAWNSTYHQGSTGKAKPLRYRVTDDGDPVAWGTGIYAHNPQKAGQAWYAVTVAVNGQEDLTALSDKNTFGPVDEVVGQGVPILQWIERIPAGKSWQYRTGPLTRLIYTRWEAWPHSSTPSKPIDYVVAMGADPLPETMPRDGNRKAWRVEPAPVGLHLHCWGGSLNGGYGWWYNANKGAVLIASNQIPYDWWTGYHEANGTCKTFGDGHVYPFTMNRVLGFLDWATTQWKEAPEIVRKDWRKLDLTRVFTAGSSMGGSGAPMYAIRYGDRIASATGWVGVHVPLLSPTFKGSYEGNYGRETAANTMPDGKTKAWDYFSDVWWMRNHIGEDTGLIIASNGKNDGGIGWKQAYLFARTLQETRRPHAYNWGMSGHGTRTMFGSGIPIDVRTDCSLPAFSNCTLDDDIGTGKLKSKEEIAAEKAKQQEEVKAGKRKKVDVCPTDGKPIGAYNAYLRWDTDAIVDKKDGWEMTVFLTGAAPKAECRVDLTPRRLQQLKTTKDSKFSYTVTSMEDETVLAQGTVTADEYDLITLKQIPVSKAKARVKIVPQ
jgi:pimeloyl-ACP methyl ester carboxylesterase